MINDCLKFLLKMLKAAFFILVLSMFYGVDTPKHLDRHYSSFGNRSDPYGYKEMVFGVFSILAILVVIWICYTGIFKIKSLFI